MIPSLQALSITDESSWPDEGYLSFEEKKLKLDTFDDAQELAEAISVCESLHTLQLNGNTIGVESSKAISQALSTKSTLKRALFYDIYTGRLREEVPISLQTLSKGIIQSGSQLTELNLSDNAFGPDGVKGIVSLLESSVCFSLEILKLNNNGLGIYGGRYLSAALTNCYKNSVEAGSPLKLKVFIAGRNRLEDEGAKALAEFFAMIESLEQVEIPQNGICCDGITALAQALAKNCNLKVLNFNDNTCTPEGAIALASEITNLECLEILNIGDCIIKSKGAAAFVNSFKEGLPSLKELILSFNEINGPIGIEVMASLKHKVYLTKVDLDGNHFGDESIAEIKRIALEANQGDLLNEFNEDEGVEQEEQSVDEEETSSSDLVKSPTSHLVREENEGDITEMVTIREPRMETITGFLLSPSGDGLLSLGDNVEQLLLDECGDNLSESESVVDLIIKFGILLEDPRPEVQQSSKHCIDCILTTASTEHNVDFIALCNFLLIKLGLLKSEDKIQALANPRPLLLSLTYVTCQTYFPKNAKQILRSFISQPKHLQILENFSNESTQLLQTLSQF